MNYQKIDIHVGPNLVPAKLISNSVCKCGLQIVSSNLGTEYQADTRSVRWIRWQCFGCGKTTETRIIDVWNIMLVPHWIFLDCLDIGMKIPIKKVNATWVTVADNMTAPAHHVPGKIV